MVSTLGLLAKVWPNKDTLVVGQVADYAVPGKP
jgi:hypothetical protein